MIRRLNDAGESREGKRYWVICRNEEFGAFFSWSLSRRGESCNQESRKQPRGQGSKWKPMLQASITCMMRVWIRIRVQGPRKLHSSTTCAVSENAKRVVSVARYSYRGFASSGTAGTSIVTALAVILLLLLSVSLTTLTCLDFTDSYRLHERNSTIASKSRCFLENDHFFFSSLRRVIKARLVSCQLYLSASSCILTN